MSDNPHPSHGGGGGRASAGYESRAENGYISEEDGFSEGDTDGGAAGEEEQPGDYGGEGEQETDFYAILNVSRDVGYASHIIQRRSIE